MGDEQGIERFRTELTRPDDHPLVITSTGIGRAVEADEYHFRVQPVDEAEPFVIEHREAQLITQWLVVSVVNMGMFGPYLVNAFFAPSQEMARELARRRAENETVHIINIADDTFVVNQRLGFGGDYVWLQAYINKWARGRPPTPVFFEDKGEAISAFRAGCEIYGGDASGASVDLLLDLEQYRVLGIMVLACLKVVVSCTILEEDGLQIIEPETGIEPTPSPSPEPDG
ncbi:MAG: hypothetical protein NT039_00130 [Candidatus Berkelbacteria bacterium]|nr:hypothetical protein [Candidatus Berkelbacteria bacterium]